MYVYTFVLKSGHTVTGNTTSLPFLTSKLNFYSEAMLTFNVSVIE